MIFFLTLNLSYRFITVIHNSWTKTSLFESSGKQYNKNQKHTGSPTRVSCNSTTYSNNSNHERNMNAIPEAKPTGNVSIIIW